MNQIVATETPVETETVIATAAGTIETELKAVTATEDETVATTDHDREIDATTRMIVPHRQIATDETVEGTGTDAAETNAEAETVIDERALAGTTIGMIAMATTETEDVRSPKRRYIIQSSLTKNKNTANYRDDRRRSASPPSLPSALPTRPHPENSSRKPQSDATRSPSPRRDRDPKRKNAPPSPSKMDQDEYDEDIEVEGQGDDDDGLAAMQAMMGFGGFGTTKGKKVVGNNAGGVRKEKKSEYRQYMNRQGGFNRPLSPSR